MTNTATHEIDPAISPDGTKIAFWRPTGSDNQVFVIDVDGTDEIAIPRPPTSFNDGEPAWSPDATQARALEPLRLADLVRPDDRERGRHGPPERVPRIGQRSIDEIEPAWSPDGTRIAYRQVPRGSSGSIGELHVVDITGGATLVATSRHRGLGCGSRHGRPRFGPHRLRRIVAGKLQRPRAADRRRRHEPVRHPDRAPASRASRCGSRTRRHRRHRPCRFTFPSGGQQTNDSTPPFAGTAGDRPGDDPTCHVAVYAGANTGQRPVRSFTVARTGTDWAVADAAWPVGRRTIARRVLHSRRPARRAPAAPARRRARSSSTRRRRAAAVTGPASPTRSDAEAHRYRRHGRG